MTNSELKEIDNALDNANNRDKILIRKRGYYIYYNEPTINTKGIILHAHDCGNCAWGSGKRTNIEPGNNGVWTGPFFDTEQATDFAKKVFKHEINKCSCVH